MCVLLYATVPSPADTARIGNSPLRLVPAEDLAVASKLLPDEQLCRVVGAPLCGGGGHCGTVLGREAFGARRNSRARDDSQIVKFRKQGWSEKKIERWFEQKQQTRTAQSPNMNGDIDELHLWNTLLERALEGARLTFLGLLLFNAGDESKVPVRCETTRRALCNLSRLEMNVLYRVTQ